jgi:hypothetical protein
VINEVSDAVVGLGPNEFLLKDPDLTEVLLSMRTRGCKSRLPILVL